MDSSKTRLHFHTFDALRFFAFFLVFLHHVPFPADSAMSFFAESGGIGVILFFILSGFLITYILLDEKQKQDRINLRNFMMRRILRIWPLYFAMVLFAILTPWILSLLNISPSDKGYEPNWFFSLTFLENYQMMLHKAEPNVSPLSVMWSLCIEEHFYILWGLLFLLLKTQKIFKVLLAYALLSLCLIGIYSFYEIWTTDLPTNLIYFSAGGLLAFAFCFNRKILLRLDQIPLRGRNFVFILILFSFFVLPHLNLNAVILPLVIVVLFVFLLAITLSDNPVKIKDSNLFSELGKYTYGMYLYHIIVINFLLKFKLSVYEVFFAGLILTVLISYLSYHLFENQFLKLKRYFR